MNYLKTIIILAIMAQVTLADKISTFSVGLSNAKSASIQTKNNMYLEINTLVKTKLKHLYVGVALNYIGWNLEGSINPDYTLSPNIIIGYKPKGSFGSKILIRTGYGYGVSRMYNKNSYGQQYGIGLQVDIYKNIGAGINFKKVYTGAKYPLPKTYNAQSIYMAIKF